MKLCLQISGQSLHHQLAPTQGLLLLDDAAAEVPVKQDQFTAAARAAEIRADWMRALREVSQVAQVVDWRILLDIHWRILKPLSDMALDITTLDGAIVRCFDCNAEFSRIAQSRLFDLYK